MLKEEIKVLSNKISNEIVSFRRHLHAHPELSFKEYKTSEFIRKQLTKLQIPWQSVTETGVVAIIKGDVPSEKVVALRADMDALPITELNEVSYASQNTGVMHACGHDTHVASLLGVAQILQLLTPRFGGTVKLIFQPGEEVLPGGASLMIKAGVLENPTPMVIIGQHVMPSIEKGKVGICAGKFMASMDELFVTVKGRGGHGAMPHLNIDPVVIASHIVIALQQIISRVANPLSPCVLSFGKMIANGAINVIPNEVHMEGTFRALDESWRLKAHDHMEKMASGIAESMGGSCDFKIHKGYPVLVNHEGLTSDIKRHMLDYLGNDKIVNAEPLMAAEDFAYYSQVSAGCFYLLGTGNETEGIVSPLHSPTFNIDESVLSMSPGLMAYLALKFLDN